jgi:cytochrome P450
MSALVQYEPMVDETTEKFLDQTQALFAAKKARCDFAEWLQFYAFDVIGNITYSKRHGFVDRAEDVDGMVQYLGKLFSYVAPIGQIPILDVLLLKNPILRFLDKHDIMSFTFPVVTFAKARMNERLAEISDAKSKGLDPTTSPGVARGDLLSMFLKAKDDRPEFFNDGRVLTMAVSMAFAGSETTAISLAAVFYYLLKNPSCYQKLIEELDKAVANGTVEDRHTGIVTWSESQKLPYLDACIKEAFRLHPAAGLPLERIVPPQGADICGEHIPGGTIVGCSAWVIHRRPEVFGEDVDAYRPERWLEVGKEQRKEMEGTMFQFGMGARTCIGKNISLLEVYKLVPSFLRRFEV